MTLGDLKNKLENIYDETDIDTEVWIGIDKHNSKKVKEVFIDFNTGDIVIK